jgi:hypothetical protein
MPAALFLLAVTIVVVTGFGWFQSVWSNRQRQTAYQAVFLTNGQVYFGKLEKLTQKEIVIVNVYYLQTSTETKSTNTNQNSNTNSTPGYSLVKLGGELHSPQDRMYINRDQVLFTEDLKDSSQVVTAIRSQK